MVLICFRSPASTGGSREPPRSTGHTQQEGTWTGQVKDTSFSSHSRLRPPPPPVSTRVTPPHPPPPLSQRGLCWLGKCLRDYTRQVDHTGIGEERAEDDRPIQPRCLPAARLCRPAVSERALRGAREGSVSDNGRGAPAELVLTEPLS